MLYKLALPAESAGLHPYVEVLKVKNITYELFWIMLVLTFIQLALWPKDTTLHFLGILACLAILAICSRRKDVSNDRSKKL